MRRSLVAGRESLRNLGASATDLAYEHPALGQKFLHDRRPATSDPQ